MLISDSRSLPQPPACRDDLGHREILGVVDVQPFDAVYDSHVGFFPDAASRPASISIAFFAFFRQFSLPYGMRCAVSDIPLDVPPGDTALPFSRMPFLFLFYQKSPLSLIFPRYPYATHPHALPRKKDLPLKKPCSVPPLLNRATAAHTAPGCHALPHSPPPPQTALTIP